MAVKKPLANYAGTLKELQTGDTVTGLGGTLIAYKANGTQDNIDLLDGGGITVLPIAQGGTGATTAAAALISLGAREVLTAARTYYVRTDGSDSNTGLVNTAGGAFLTIQKAVDVVCSLDTADKIVTIQLANGTYNESVLLKGAVGDLGYGNIRIKGDETTPSNVLIQPSSGNCFYTTTRTAWLLSGMKLVASAGSGIGCFSVPAYILYGNIDFGACSVSHIINYQSSVVCSGNYTISGSAPTHIQTGRPGAYFQVASKTITITGTPNFSYSFAYPFDVSMMLISGVTFSGSATGKRYTVTMNSVLNTGGGTLPGDVAGTTATGGQYA